LAGASFAFIFVGSKLGFTDSRLGDYEFRIACWIADAFFLLVHIKDAYQVPTHSLHKRHVANLWATSLRP
jgi:hypothetical protein